VAAKMALAAVKIDCSGPLDETRRQVQAFAEGLRPASPGK